MLEVCWGMLGVCWGMLGYVGGMLGMLGYPHLNSFPLPTYPTYPSIPQHTLSIPQHTSNIPPTYPNIPPQEAPRCLQKVPGRLRDPRGTSQNSDFRRIFARNLIDGGASPSWADRGSPAGLSLAYRCEAGSAQTQNQPQTEVASCGMLRPLVLEGAALER